MITSPLFVVPLIVAIFFIAIRWATGGLHGGKATNAHDEHAGK